MNDFPELFDRATMIQYRISENDKVPKGFGSDTLMYQSEIHFIDAIGLTDGVCVSDMIQKLSITNRAITQISNKLIRKGMIEKFKIPANKKTFTISLHQKASLPITDINNSTKN